MTRIVMTEITRFANKDIVCSAGIDTESGRCYRPIPYLNSDRCRELGMVPGAVLSGDLAPTSEAAEPHIEDSSYENLTFNGHCSNDEFHDVLANSAVDSVEEGFGIRLKAAEKCIEPDLRPRCSLITVRVDPATLSIVPDQYNVENVKAHFTDGGRKQFRFLTVTDLGFADLVGRIGSASVCAESQRVFRQQPNVYIRLGLSRQFQAPDGRSGYWLQVNGIYGFPEFYRPAREYCP